MRKIIVLVPARLCWAAACTRPSDDGGALGTSNFIVGAASDEEYSGGRFWLYVERLLYAVLIGCLALCCLPEDRAF